MARYPSAFVVLLAAAPAYADEPTDRAKLTATMQCDPAREAGRLRCAIEARAAAGLALPWADTVLLDVPDFTTALKGRIGPADSVARDPGSQRWAFGLVARKTGTGEVHARVRGLVCEPLDGGAPRCTAVSVEVRATVRVG